MNRLTPFLRPRLVRAAAGLLALLVVLVAALQGDAATTLVVGVLALLAFGTWWRHHAAAALCTLSLAVTLLCTSATTQWAAEHSPLVSAVQSGLVFWLFAGVVVGIVWWAPDRGRSQATTTGVAHAVLVVASFFVVLAPSTSPIAGLCGAIAVVGWRSRRRRDRSVGPEAVAAADRAAESRGVLRTREVLSAVCADGWQLFPDWSLAEQGPVVEALMIGLRGVLMIETRDWRGSVDLVDVGGSEAGAGVTGSTGRPVPSQAYALNGDARELVARLAPCAHNVRLTAELLDVAAGGVVGVVVFWGETTVAGDVAELTMLSASGAGRRPVGMGAEDVPLFLLHGERLASWLSRQPVRLDAEQVARLVHRADAENSLR